MTECIFEVDIEEGGRVSVGVKNFYGDFVPIDRLDQVKSLNKFNWTISVNAEATFEMISKHYSDAYDATTDNGTVKIVGTQVKYTPTAVGVGGFTLNGTKHNVTVIANQPVKPSLTLPTEGSVALPPIPVLASTAFVSDDVTVTHTSSRWQIATDPLFVNIVLDVESTTSLTTFQSSRLSNGVTYYSRVKHIGTKP